MARSFAGSPDRLVAASAAVTAYPITMSCWLNTNSVTSNQVAMAVAAAATDNARFELRLNSSGQAQARAVDSTGTSAGISSAALSASTWYHAGAVFVGDANRTVYLNGTGTSHTTSRTVDPSSFTTMTVGCVTTLAGSFGSYFSGDIAEPAIWSVALTADEISLLASGYSPLFVRPQSLVFYAPLFGRAGASGDEEDWSNGRTLVQTSSPAVADHPRIIYPRRRIITPVGAAAPTTFIPSWARQNSRVIGGGV